MTIHASRHPIGFRLAVILLALIASATIVRAQGGGDLEALKTDFEAKGPKDFAAKRTTLLAIAAIPGAESVAFLEKIAKTAADYGVKRAALEALAGMNDPAAARTIETFIATTSISYSDRYAAVDVLDVERPATMEFLKTIIRNAKPADMRYIAAAKLARSKKDDAIAFLKDQFRNGDDQTQAFVLNAIAGQVPIDQIYLDMISPAILPQAGQAVRQAALRALATAKDQRFFAAVNGLISKERMPYNLANWIRDAALFDDVPALQLMMNLLGKEGDSVITTAFQEALAEMQSRAIRDWLRLKAPTAAQKTVKLGALRHFAKKPAEGDEKAVSALSQDRDPDIAREATLLLRKYKGAEVDQALNANAAHKEIGVAAAALDSLWMRGEPPPALVQSVRESAQKSKSWELRVVALSLLKRADPVSARTIATANFKHARRQVREAAYDLTAACKDREAVTTLIEQLAVQESQDQRYIADVLCEMTDFDWGANADRWKKWWAGVPDGFALKAPGGTKKSTAAAQGYGSYYGISVKSDRVAFLIDCSGSMNERYQTGTRMEAAKGNLTALVRKFDDRMRFTIIAFDTGLRPFDIKLVQAKKPDVERAEKWIQALAPAGGTNIYDTLEKALEMEEVETIFLLTDGAPSAGKITDTESILQRVRLRNQFLRVKINAIDIGGDPISSKFLKRLAEENYGEYVKPK